jgi:spore protease
MGHDVDLSKYSIRTDLAIDVVSDSLKKNVYSENGIDVTSICIDDSNSSFFSKKPGNYITISFSDVTDSSNKDNVVSVFSNQLSLLFSSIGINDDDYCLVVGLGNDKSTPDSLGPGTVDKLIVTNHLYLLGCLDNGFRRVSAISPGVTGTTGIETCDVIKGIVDKVNPDFLIVIDALASSSLDRVNKTIQITDTGIHPGSGIGNSRKEISFSTMGIPVIAIGVPTTVDAVTIVSDTISYMEKHFSYVKNNINNPINKLIVGGVNYLKKDVHVNDSDKKELLGLVGNLDDLEVRKLVSEVLTPVGYNFMVTPKEVDFVVSKLCDVISDGLNMSLHKKV